MSLTQRLILDAKAREKLFIELYQKGFPALAMYVSKMGGTFDEAKDVFQDALVIYYEKRLSVDSEPPKNPLAYILGTAKHLWFRKYREAKVHQPLDGMMEDFEVENYQEPSLNKLVHYLESAGKKCMDMLSAFYYEKLDMSTIARQFGFSSERSATVQKYKCLEKVRDKVKENALTYEDFLE